MEPSEQAPTHTLSPRQPSSLQLLQGQMSPKKWENPLVPEEIRAKFKAAGQLEVFQVCGWI